MSDENTLKLVYTTMASSPLTKEMFCKAADFSAGLLSVLGDKGVEIMPVDRMVLLIDLTPKQSGPEIREDSIWRVHLRSLYVDIHIGTLSQCGRAGPFEFMGRYDNGICRMIAGKQHVVSFESPVPREVPLRIKSDAKLWPEYQG